MNRKALLLSLVCLACSAWLQAFAVPANPTPVRKRLSSGGEVTVRHMGDEHLSWFEAEDGRCFIQNEEGLLQIADGELIHAASRRSQGLISKRYKAVSDDFLNSEILVALVSFSDTRFELTEDFDAFFTGDTQLLKNKGYNYIPPGGLSSYWEPYINRTLSFTVKTISADYDAKIYGENINGSDKGRLLLRQEVLKKCEYDENCNKNLVIVFAGMGEADGGGPDTIWPCCSGIGWTLDCSGTIFTCEKSSKGTPSFGTLVHEFGHAMGLPDLYDVNKTAEGTALFTPNKFSVMDTGSYNGDCMVPPQLSSIERLWMPEAIRAQIRCDINAETTIPDVSCGNLYYYENPLWPGEWAIVEYRPKTGWDACLPSTENDMLWFMLDRRDYYRLPGDYMTTSERFDNRYGINNKADHPLYSRIKMSSTNCIRLWEKGYSGERIPMGYYLLYDDVRSNGNSLSFTMVGDPNLNESSASAVLFATSAEGGKMTKNQFSVSGYDIIETGYDGVFILPSLKPEEQKLFFIFGEDFYEREITVSPVLGTSICINVSAQRYPDEIRYGLLYPGVPNRELSTEGKEEYYLWATLNIPDPPAGGYLQTAIELTNTCFPDTKGIRASLFRLEGENGESGKTAIVTNAEVSEDNRIHFEAGAMKGKGKYLLVLSFPKERSDYRIRIRATESNPEYDMKIRTLSVPGGYELLDEGYSMYLFVISSRMKK